MARKESYKNISLCWGCRHAVPKTVNDERTGEPRYIRGCPWSIYKQPVPGWDAERGYIRGAKGQRVVCYYVNHCPLFERGRN